MIGGWKFFFQLVQNFFASTAFEGLYFSASSHLHNFVLFSFFFDEGGGEGGRGGGGYRNLNLDGLTLSRV